MGHCAVLTHATYSTQNPLPSRPSGPIVEQIYLYVNQQEWYPEIDKKYARRNSADDLRKHKCKARYKAQFANGPVTAQQLMRAFHIERQSVNLKMREYKSKGFVSFNELIQKWEWIEDGSEEC